MPDSTSGTAGGATTPPGIALWVSPVGEVGGVGRHFLDVAHAGIPGWRVVFLVPDGPLADGLRKAGAAVLTGALGPQAGLRASVATLRTAIRRLRPRIVHSHLSYADIVAALATRGTGVRLLSTEHGIAPGGLYQANAVEARAMARVHQARGALFDRLIAVSESTRDVMRAKWHLRRPLDVIRNGVDRPGDRPRRRAAEGPRLVSLARLSPEKGIDHLLRAFALVLGSRPTARLTIAGTGPLEDELRRQAAELGVAGAVDFPGFVDAGELLGEADVLVQLSAWENCSYTLLDACVAGVGVVATPVGGNPEILPARCLVPGDRPDRVAAAVLEQFEHPERRPGLPAGWPTVGAMVQAIASCYGEASP